MNVDPALLPAALLWGLAPVYGAGLVWLLGAAPWALLRRNRLEPLLPAAMGCVGILWSMSAGIQPGLELHLLGASALTLLLGWRLAMVAANGALAGLTVLGLFHWQAFAANGLLLTVLPVLVTHWIGRWAYRHLPRNLFVYLFAVAFFGAMASVAAVMLLSAGTLLAAGAYTPAILVRDYLAMMPLIMFPEGFITGMVMTMLVVYRPEWVRTFDDRDYIEGK